MYLISRHGILIAYLILVHVFLALVVWKSDFLPRVKRKLEVAQGVHKASGHYESMLQYHLRMDGNVPNKAVVFIGDSLVQGLHTNAVACPSVNYGIGGDTTVGVLGRMPQYRSLLRASAVVLAIGFNDMNLRDNQGIIQNYRRILKTLPPDVPLVCSAVLPVNEAKLSTGSVSNARIRDLNAGLKALCQEDGRRLFLDIGGRLVDTKGDLSAAFQDGDGVHLNSAGNGIWIEELRVAVRNVRHDNPNDMSKGVKQTWIGAGRVGP